MKDLEEYISKAITTTIGATSRSSVKIKDSYYTVEYHEERSIPDIEDVDIEMERSLLWDTCNNEVDNQIAEIIKVFGN